ncbi:MAG: LysR family transcriptional regulator [Pseudomonadota bacterium]
MTQPTALNIKSFIRRVDLLTLRLFISLAEERHLGNCSLRENIAASAITKRIHDLEDALGSKVFYREAKGFVLTPAGHAVEAHVREMFETLSRLRSDISEFADGARGHVRLWANESCIVQFLARDLRDFAVQFPLVEVELHEDLTPPTLQAVERGEADLGIVASYGDAVTNLTTVPYRTEQLCAVVRTDHPLASQKAIGVAQLIDAGFIGFAESGALMQQVIKAAAELGKPLVLRHRVRNNHAARSMVRAGLGVTIQAAGMLEPEPNPAIIAIPLSESWGMRQLLIAMRSEAGLPVPARALLKHLRG